MKAAFLIVFVAAAAPPSTSFWTNVQASLDESVGELWPVVTALAAVGFAVMAILQAVKDMTRARDAFDRWIVRSWLKKQAATASLKMERPIEANVAYRDMVQLATAGDERAFFALDASQLVGQISSATQIVLDFPHRHEPLFRCLALGVEPGDIQRILGSAPGMRVATLPNERSSEDSELIDARTRVTHQIQRTLDALLVSLNYRWTYWNQVVAMGLNVLLVMLLFSVSPLGRQIGVAGFWIALPMGIISGFVAPVAKDLVSALQQLKNRAR